MYGDFECPYCAASQSILARVRSRLGDDLRFAFRHLPLEDVHPHARRAAEAAEAAAAQGAFWEMHDALYAARGHLEDARPRRPTRAGSGSTPTASPPSSRPARTAPAWSATPSPPRALGISSTPAFFVNGVLHADSYDAGSLVAALKDAAPRASARTSASTCTPPRNTTADAYR